MPKIDITNKNLVCCCKIKIKLSRHCLLDDKIGRNRIPTFTHGCFSAVLLKGILFGVVIPGTVRKLVRIANITQFHIDTT
jgi:hypothetical protein